MELKILFLKLQKESRFWLLNCPVTKFIAKSGKSNPILDIFSRFVNFVYFEGADEAHFFQNIPNRLELSVS